MQCWRRTFARRSAPRFARSSGWSSTPWTTICSRVARSTRGGRGTKSRCCRPCYTKARMARRLVVLVSDHGHVLDCQTQARLCEGGERSRTASGEPAADELLVQGQRSC